MKPQDLHTATIRISTLRPYSGNPRRGDVAAIAASLKQNGLYRPLVANRRTMEVLAGNHTLMAARELGWREIAVTFVDCDPDQARRIVLADNRTNDLAGYDSEALAELLAELPSLEGTGYDEAALDALLDELGARRDPRRGRAPSPPRRSPNEAGGRPCARRASPRLRRRPLRRGLPAPAGRRARRAAVDRSPLRRRLRRKDEGDRYFSLTCLPRARFGVVAPFSSALASTDRRPPRVLWRARPQRAAPSQVQSRRHGGSEFRAREH
jgi:hypothetical protein